MSVCLNTHSLEMLRRAFSDWVPNRNDEQFPFTFVLYLDDRLHIGSRYSHAYSFPL